MHKSTTRDKQLYFPSEGSHTQDFYALKKNPSTPAGYERANLGSSGEYNYWTTGVDGYGGESQVMESFFTRNFLTSQVISVTFYIERENSDKFCLEALNFGLSFFYVP